MPAGFRQSEKAKKTNPNGYCRADNLNKKKLRKYIKATAKEAELYQNAREMNQE